MVGLNQVVYLDQLENKINTFANNAGKINKLVMVFAFNPGILITSSKIYKPTAPVVLLKLSVT